MIDIRYVLILFVMWGFIVFMVVSDMRDDTRFYWDAPNPDHQVEPLDQDPTEKFGDHNHPHPHPHDPNQPPATCCPHGPGMRPKEDPFNIGTLA